MNYVAIENTVDRLIGKIGAKSLLARLEFIEKEEDVENSTVSLVKAFVFQYCEVSEKNALNVSNIETNAVLARRLLVHLLMTRARLTKKDVGKVVGFSNDLINNYRKHIGSVINNRYVDPPLFDALYHCEEKFKINNNAG